MAIGSVLQTGITGIQRGVRGAADAADKIAKVGVDSNKKEDATNDITTAAVSLKQNELQVKASAKVVKAGSDILGSILDIKA